MHDPTYQRSSDGDHEPMGLGTHPGPGDTVGSYRLEELLGTGGMATVYRAVDPRGASVALKVLNPARVLPEDVKRFTREYRALSRMDHENVVKVYEAGVHHGYPWIAMEFVDGTDLGTVIERWQGAPPTDRFERAERILRGLCRGLQYVHDLGMIHRDLKPGNVLLTREGDAKISDFGVVKSGGNTHNTQLTMAGRLVGTVAFMAPELITDEGVDRRTDLYALGAVLYMLCTFRRPIEAESVAGYLARHLTEVPPPAGEVEPACPPRLEAVCQRLLQKDRTLRYPSAQAVLQALDQPDHREAPPLRGRDDEIARFGRTLLSLQEGVGAVVAVVGPPGSGKTHLLRGFLDQVHGHGLRLAATDGAEGDTVAKLLVAAGGKASGASRDLAELARTVRGSPFVLAVDDLDRATPSALHGLAGIVRQRVAIEAEPLLLLFTATDTEGDLAPVLSGATGLPCEVIPAGPLDAKSVVALLRDRGLTGPTAAVLGRRLVEEYGGLPGPTIHQLDALVQDGWLCEELDGLRPLRPLEAFRRDDLPVPPDVRRELEVQVAALDTRSRDLVEILALLDRPASAGLLERCTSRDPEAARHLDGLVQLQLLERLQVETQEVLQFAHPCAARVVRGELPADRRRAHHATIADALRARRRRANVLEMAHHREQAGDAAGAYPLLVQAARRSARDGRYVDVLDLTSRAEALRETAEASVEPRERLRLRRWLHLLTGEAQLARRSWQEAVTPLEAAVDAARAEEDPQALVRCLGSLGRAWYRLGRFDVAAPLLREALEQAEPGAPERASATRALADIELRAGQHEAAEALWLEALDVAIDMGSRDAEARARRGLAHLRALQGRLHDASELLGRCEDLLEPDGDHRVRAGALARAIELDAAAGHLTTALHRSELLVELSRRHAMSHRLPEAYALLAQILAFLNDAEEARDAAHQSLVFARAHAAASWDARLRAGRILCDLAHPEEAREALPEAESLPPSDLDDPAAQLAAVRARLLASESPSRARDLAAWALTRPAPRMCLRTAVIALDAAKALTAAGQPDAARSAVKHGLKALEGPGSDGLRLELLVAMQQAQPDPRVEHAIVQVAHRIEHHVPPSAAARFRRRPVLAALLPRGA